MKTFLISSICCLIIFVCFIYQFYQAQKWKDKALQYQQNGVSYLEKCNEVTTMQLTGLKKLDSIIQLRDAKLKVYEEAYGKVLMPGESMRIDFKIDLRDPDHYKIKQ